MMNEEIREPKQAKLSVCGTDCSSCYCYGQMCTGCHACEGKVFHMPEGSVCGIYECSVQNKGLSHCGECSLMPCEIWRKTRDPKYSDEEFEENIRMRTQALRNS